MKNIFARYLLKFLCVSCLSLTFYPQFVQADVHPSKVWGIVIHGGVSSHVHELSPKHRKRYFRHLGLILARGKNMLKAGKPALDVVEEVVAYLESNPLFNAGRGAVFTYDGIHELDASIMDGSCKGCGAVAAVKTVCHPIRLARAVMDHSRHVFLAGSGAEAFAKKQGLQQVRNTFFDTKLRKAAWRRRRSGTARASDEGSTVGCVALDRNGNLAAATSTGGLTDKRWGRVGDSPVIGAGTWADNGSCAVSCTGRGEDYIRNAAAHSVSAAMVFGDMTVSDAASHVLGKLLPRKSGGLIAIDRNGRVVTMANTRTMLHAAANSHGIHKIGLYPDACKY